MTTKQMIANLLGLRLSQVTVKKCFTGSSKGTTDIYIKGVDYSTAKEAVRNVLPPDTKFFLQVI